MPDTVGCCGEGYTGHEASLAVRKLLPTYGGGSGHQVSLCLPTPKQELRTGGEGFSGKLPRIWDTAVGAQRCRIGVHFGGGQVRMLLDGDTVKPRSSISCTQPGRSGEERRLAT